MARIRSIKPEFWSDEKIVQLSHGCMAFFIGLWNFCDDEGKVEDNPKQLSLRMPVFRPEDIKRWIEKLVAIRLLTRGSLVAMPPLSSGSPTAPPPLPNGSSVAWLRVTNWSHQRIDRPQMAKIKMEDIQWFVESNSSNDRRVFDEQSSNDRESSSNVRRKDRIGKDRIKDRIGSESSSTVVTVPVTPVAVESVTEPVDLNSESEVVSAIPERTKRRWAVLYPEREFLEREVLKAFNYYENNPKKKPKNIRGWSRALSSWFERGWRSHVRTIPTEAGSNIDWQKVFEEPGGAA